MGPPAPTLHTLALVKPGRGFPGRTERGSVEPQKQVLEGSEVELPGLREARPQAGDGCRRTTPAPDLKGLPHRHSRGPHPGKQLWVQFGSLSGWGRGGPLSTPHPRSIHRQQTLKGCPGRARPSPGSQLREHGQGEVGTAQWELCPAALRTPAAPANGCWSPRDKEQLVL